MYTFTPSERLLIQRFIDSYGNCFDINYRQLLTTAFTGVL